jgi:ubiquinone/menaquinone biosynthesis C-methylase UbiE
MYGKWSSLYDKWCECYDVKNNETRIIEAHLTLHNKTILDIGCGTGRLTLRLAERAKFVFGVDFDSESTSVFTRKLATSTLNNIQIITSDIVKTDFQAESLDIIVFSWSYYSLSEGVQETVLEKIKHWLKPEGILLILQPDSGQFEEVMRSAFVENQEHEEYIDCFDNIKMIEDHTLKFIEEFAIRQNFEFSDIDFGVEAIKMFAITEGSYTADPSSIPTEPIKAQFEQHFQNGRYVLDDYVRGFIFRKQHKAV